MTVERIGASRFVPALESLSDRVVPSCTWTEVGGVLTVSGDSSANVIDIVDDGTTLTITCDGEAVPLTGTVTDVVLSLGSGNDEVTYTLQGALAAGATRTIDAWLGNGNDTFTATLEDGTDAGTGDPVTSALGDGAVLDITARGTNGKDSLSFDAAATAVGTGAELSVAFGGGNGKDVLDFAFGGVLLGDLTLSASGGNGNDEVSGDATFDATSTGTADLEVLGGNGKDTLTLFATDASGEPSTLGELLATANGGHGPDWVDVTDNVEVLGAKKKN